ncbi:MAG: hypothetical protein KAU20_02995, partial [Nanoarchaeota archaeon]|nr:hypothetical protein [Nanoarchaeota archaeon]
LIKPAYTGYVALEDNGSYTDILNINITSNTSYIWEPEHKGNIDSIRLSGYLEGDYANVYVKKDNKSYLVYGYNINITAKAVEVSSGDSEINISFEYYDRSSYDADNNGIAHINDIIDFNVNNTVFNFDINYSKVCTKYKVDNKELNTSVCYGYDECCLFMGLSPESENWDDIFYLNYGKFNSGYNNTVYSQVVYYDVSLEEEDLHSYVYNSGVYALDAVFVDRVYFNDACVESCLLSGFDEDTYDLVFEVGGIVYVDNISYGISSSVEEEIVSISDKDKKKIGHYKLKNKTNGKYDLEISSLEESKKGIMGLDKESKAKIKNIKEIKRLNVYIDESLDGKVNTDVFAVNESLEFDYAEITLVKNGNVNAVMYCSEFDFDEFSCREWEKTSIPFVDNGNTITFTVNHFSAYAGAEINVINVHSYPSLHGNWTVMFNTTGVADLTITATRDVNYSEEYTRWSDYSESGLYDLKFLEIRCGDEVKQYEWQGSNCYENECSVFIEDYSCNDTAYEVSKVLTAKKHVLKFSFGKQEVYAYNDVSPIEIDYMEYSSDANAQAAYVSSDASGYTAITNVTELQAMQNNLAGNYYLANDIDASDTVNWNGGQGFYPVYPFTGILDGHGHTIADLYINRTMDVALILISSGIVRNLGMIDVDITSPYGSPGSSIVGTNYNGGAVTNCYATGSVSVTAEGSGGGLVGNNNRDGIITNCYSTCLVAPSGAMIGGLVGRQYYGGTTVNSFWDTETSGQGSSAGGTGKTTVQMKQEATFTNWNFSTIWNITENVTYPFLQP